MQLSPPIPGAGLWVQDRLEHLGAQVRGRVVPIDIPYLLNARKQLHAGYIPPNVDARSPSTPRRYFEAN